MEIRKFWSMLAMALVIVMTFALFACTPEDSEESSSEPKTEESESSSQVESGSGSESESEDGSESESKNEDSSASGECQHSEFYYEDLGDGSKCKKVCSNCKETLSTAKHTKGDPDPEDNCNIRCKKCNYLMQENKHTRGTPDPNDNCNVKCTKCSKILLEAKHSTPDEDAVWTVDAANPQQEFTDCTNCGAKAYRSATATLEGLKLVSPGEIAEAIKNNRVTGALKTDDNGMTYYSMTATGIGSVTEITVTLNDGKEAYMGVGGYVAMLVRHESDEAEAFDFWINKEGRVGPGDAGTTSYAKCITTTLESDGNWRILMFDFSQCAYIDTENGVGWVRFDVNSPATGSVIDIGFIGFFSSEEAISDYYKAYVDAYIGSNGCTHISDNKQVVSATTPGTLVMHCLSCGSEINAIKCEHTDLSALSNITAVESAGLVKFKADCASCGLTGAELLSLNSDKNKTFTAAELAAIAHNQAAANLENNGGYGRYNVTLVNNDASVNNMPYVKFTAKIAAECCLLLNDGSATLDGQYLGKYVAILYRKPETTKSPAVQLLYTKSGSTTYEGYVSGVSDTVNDGAWHIMIIDLSSITSVNIEDGTGWTRLDILDPRSNSQIAAGDEIDIAFVSFFDSKEAANQYYSDYLTTYLGMDNCTHRFDSEWQGTGKLNEMQNVCAICSNTVVRDCAHHSNGNWIKHSEGKVQSVCTICTATIVKACDHVSDGNWIATGNKFEYKSTCTVCDSQIVFVCKHSDNKLYFTATAGEYRLVCTFCEYDRVSSDTTTNGLKLFGASALANAGIDCFSNINGTYTTELLSDTAKNNMPFVRFQLLETTPAETFLWINEKGEAKIDNVGAYFMIIYRLSANCPTGVEVFISATDGNMTGDNGKKVNLVADGEWHYAIVDFSKVKGWNGTESIQQLRIDLFNAKDVPAEEYFDIAAAGFFNSSESATAFYNAYAGHYDMCKHSVEWKYVSNANTVYADTRYAVEGGTCKDCGKYVTRAAVIAFNVDTITSADINGANVTLAGGVGSGYGPMVTDPTLRVTNHETVYLRKDANGQFIVAAGWVGVNGDFDTSNGYYRILDENGNPLTDWIAKPIAGTDVKDETAGSYKSIKGQLAAQGVTDFVARGFKTNNLFTTINGVEYAKCNQSISIEYAVKAVNAPEGSDLITLVVFKNIYSTSHSYTDWEYVSGEGTEWEGTGYAVQKGTCKDCGATTTRAAVIAFNIDSITAADGTGANAALTGTGSGYGVMVTDPASRVTSNEAIYLRSNQFIVATGWIGVSGDFDTSKAYYRILDENGNALTDWTEKVISDTAARDETTGSYKSIKGQLAAQGVTDFVARGFKTNNLFTTIDGVEYASKDTPIAIEYAVKIVGAPEGYDLVRVIIFQNVYKY